MFNKRNTPQKDLTPEDLYLDIEGESVSYVAERSFRPTVSIVGGLALIVLVLLWSYTLKLQTISGQRAEELSYANTYIEPQRGKIFSADGTLLASNSPAFDVIIFPNHLPQSLDATVTSLAQVLDVDESTIRERIKANQDKKQFTLVDNISTENAIQMQTEKKIEGVVLKKHQKRNYRYSKVFAHILGYTGKISRKQQKEFESYLLNDTIGKRGIEQVYERRLHGEYGVRAPLDTDQIRKEPVPGQSLQLTIDSEFQKSTYDKLQQIIRKDENIDKGIAIAMDPRSGEVRALVSLPSYDANTFIGGISSEQYQTLQTNAGNPLLNKAIQGEYAPGSTVKPLLAGAMLQEGIITPETEINDPDGKLIVPNPYNPGNPAVFPDWRVHGKSDVYKAIADSVNVFFYTFGGGTPDHEGLGIERIVSYYRKFGFGTPTGIDLPNERGGRLPYTNLSPKEKEQWTRGRTYNVSIGQGTLTVTPLQIATYISAIANGGTLHTPHLVDKAFNFSKTKLQKDFQPDPKQKNLLNPKDLTIVQEGMRQTVTDGTGDQLQDLSFKTAAKSGTAQTSQERNNSWFTAYGPYEHPELVVTVLVPQGDDSGETAVPVAKHMLRWWKKHRGFEKQSSDSD